MKEIKIVSRWNFDKVLLCGKYESIKECLEKNKGADLRGADLTRADLTRAALRGAALRGADLRGADLTRADLRGAALRGADLTGADLTRADLRGADLTGAALRGADLTRADLTGAALTRAKKYFNSHEVALEIIRTQEQNFFSNSEWIIIGKISLHRFCWDKLITEYKEVKTIFEKLAKLGYKEYLAKFRLETKKLKRG